MPESAEMTMTPEQARAACDAGMHAMALIRWMTGRTVADLTPEQWLHQVAPGTNHPMFNFGHLVRCDGNFCLAAGGRSSVPDSYGPLFDGGASPVTDARAYPKPAELLKVAERARAELMARLQSLSGAELLAPFDEPRLSFVAPTLAHLPGFIALHEGSHTGQIMIVRRALGLPGVLGG